MKNVSNEFKNIIKSGGPFYAYASITLKNGEKLVLVDVGRILKDGVI